MTVTEQTLAEIEVAAEAAEEAAFESRLAMERAVDERLNDIDDALMTFNAIENGVRREDGLGRPDVAELKNALKRAEALLLTLSKDATLIKALQAEMLEGRCALGQARLD